jgi:transposase InsO family protein
MTIRMGRCCMAKDVVAVLKQKPRIYSETAYIRSDNAKEFISQALRSCCEASSTSTVCIEPVSPWENGYSESYKGRLRDEFINTELVTTAPENELLDLRLRRQYTH